MVGGFLPVTHAGRFDRLARADVHAAFRRRSGALTFPYLVHLASYIISAHRLLPLYMPSTWKQSEAKLVSLANNLLGVARWPARCLCSARFGYMNERPKVGSGQVSLDDRNWVSSHALQGRLSMDGGRSPRLAWRGSWPCPPRRVSHTDPMSSAAFQADVALRPAAPTDLARPRGHPTPAG